LPGTDVCSSRLHGSGEFCVLVVVYAEKHKIKHRNTVLKSFIELPCYPYIHESRGTAVAQWVRCCATNRKVTGLIPAGVSG